MAIQSTQVPMYTKHTLFFFFIYEKQNKAKLEEKKKNHTHTQVVQSIKTHKQTKTC